MSLRHFKIFNIHNTGGDQLIVEEEGPSDLTGTHIAFNYLVEQIGLID